MRNFLKAFLVFLCWAVLALLVYNRNSYYDDPLAKQTTGEEKAEIQNDTIKKQENSPPATVIPQKTIETISETKETITVLPFNHKFITHNSHTRVLFPQNFHYFKDSIYNFLNHHPDKEIIISAQYLPSEMVNNNLTFGKARAEYLKSQLVKYGVNPLKLVSKDSVTNYTYDKDGYYANGITISFKNISKEKRATLEQEITHKTLYPDFNTNTVKPDKTIQAYTVELKNYLQKHPEKKVTITGHTDNMGNDDSNYQIALERAKSIAAYFENIGIDKNKLNVQSKGETAPIVDNNTTKNRIKNKRIEILIN
ncbi:OmpA family protein [Tenacibaculum sp. TC6]|uniref:OmpA family protein n=1 Tax=Tenacibaculum sp. TC6 TaxID=3423223 RepID=UPI003D35B8E5